MRIYVQAVDEINRKRKLERTTSPNGSVKTSGSSTNGDSSYQFGMLPPDGSAGKIINPYIDSGGGSTFKLLHYSILTMKKKFKNHSFFCNI